MNRTLRANLPTTNHPEVDDHINHKVKAQKSQAMFYDRGTKSLSKLQPGDVVHIRTPEQSSWSEKGSVIESVGPRSYIIKSGKQGIYRRNLKHLLQTK